MAVNETESLLAANGMTLAVIPDTLSDGSQVWNVMLAEPPMPNCA